MSSQSALIKRAGWRDNPEVAQSLKTGAEEQISWLNDLSPRQHQAGRGEGPYHDWCGRRWWRWAGGGGRVYVARQWKLSASEWSVFINLEPLPCQRERTVPGGGEPAGGGVKQNTICIPQAHLLTRSPLHSHSPPAPPLRLADQLPVRLFNFAEIGPWQLCHADEKSGSLSRLVHLVRRLSRRANSDTSPHHLWG